VQKLLAIPRYFASTYEPSIQLLDLGTRRQGHEKYASEAWDYIQHVKSVPGRRYILVIAMGAGEYWSSNKNGDYFPEKDLKLSYRNFETTFDHEGKINGGALIFKHHKNKLHLNHPWFGVVKKAFYNDKMHRVELLLEIHADKAQDLIDKVDIGETIAVSMGVRIPYDICSLCNHQAAKREEYCDHLRFELNDIKPDGRKVYAINGNYDYTKHKKPLNFFDISVVFRPADQTGYMLKKVADYEDERDIGGAELFDKQASLKEKVAYLRKLSTIDKVIQAIPIAEKDNTSDVRAIKAFKPTLDKVVGQMKPLGADKIESLAGFPLNKVLSTLSANNMILTTPEFLSLVLTKLLGFTVRPEALRPLAAAQGAAFAELADNPELLEEIEAYDMFQEVDPDEDVHDIIKDVKDNRDLSESGILKKASTDLLRASLDFEDQTRWGDGKGMLHTETVTDPQTGRKYHVSMDAIEDAQMYKNMSAVGKALVKAVALGGVYFGLRNQRGILGKGLAPLAGIAAIALGLNDLKDIVIRDKSTGYRMTDKGTPVASNAIMMEKKSAVMPWLNQKMERAVSGAAPHFFATALPVAGTSLLHNYYADRLQTGLAGTYRTDTEKDLDDAGRAAYVHPYLTAGAGIGAANMGLHGLNKIRQAVFRK